MGSKIIPSASGWRVTRNYIELHKSLCSGTLLQEMKSGTRLEGLGSNPYPCLQSRSAAKSFHLRVEKGCRREDDTSLSSHFQYEAGLTVSLANTDIAGCMKPLNTYRGLAADPPLQCACSKPFTFIFQSACDCCPLGKM